MKKTLLAAATLVACSACATFPLNPALEQVDETAGYRFKNLTLEPTNSDDTFVILTLSGGGTRAAAFAYGVMRGLERAAIAGAPARSLLDEVDVISSVSGGSFAAAYYGAFGKERFFERFPDEVLNHNIQRALLLKVLAPWNWPSLLSSKYARSDLADEYYDEQFFAHKTFDTLPRHRPQIILNATDLSLGAQFSFTQDHFDRICSDLSKVKLSRGVVASSAFPVAFTPITLRNHASSVSCAKPPPEEEEEEEEEENDSQDDLEVSPQKYDRVMVERSYKSADRPYLHLNDGGLADNIGLRGPFLGVRTPTEALGLIEKLNERAVKRLVFIIVDAKPGKDTSLDRGPRPPGIIKVLSTSATNPMENYSSDTVHWARTFAEDWLSQQQDAVANAQACAELARDLCPRGSSSGCYERRREDCRERFFVEVDEESDEGLVTPYHVHLRFELDPNHAEELKKIKTRLRLRPSEIRLLIDSGEQMLWRSRSFRALMAALNPGWEPPAGAATDADVSQ